METPREGPKIQVSGVDLNRCCAEAQCDGVPCPTIGRSCEVCERALRSADDPAPKIDWPMRDR